MQFLSSALGVCRRALSERRLRIGQGLQSLRHRLRGDMAGVIGEELGDLARELLLALLSGKPGEVLDDLDHHRSDPWDLEESWSRPEPSSYLSDGTFGDFSPPTSETTGSLVSDFSDLLTILRGSQSSHSLRSGLWVILLPRLLPWLSGILGQLIAEPSLAGWEALLDALLNPYRLHPHQSD